MLTKDGTRPRVYLLPPEEPDTAKDHWVEKLRAASAKRLGNIYDQKGSYASTEEEEESKEFEKIDEKTKDKGFGLPKKKSK